MGNSLQISAPAGGLNLPFSGSASSSGSIFTLTNSGSGPAGVFLGKVGIGTATPSLPLHIASDLESVMILQDTGPASTQSGYVGFWNAAPTETAWVGFGTPGSPHFSVVNARPGGDIALWAGNAQRLTVASSGNVGIGTTTPTARLDVRGEIRLGSTGQFRATAGEENLRIIRGAIRNDGQIVRGSGFTSERLDEGKFRITFNTPNSAVPTATATADRGPGAVPAVGFDFGSPASSQVTFVTYGTASEVFLDVGFNFIVIGPR